MTYICDVVWALACLVLLEQFVACRPSRKLEKRREERRKQGILPCIVKLFQSVLEHFLLLILFQEGITLPEFVILVEHSFE